MPVGSNRWTYDELPQHLKDYMAKYQYSLTDANRNTYYGADAFNRTDRSFQDHWITNADKANLQIKTNELKQKQQNDYIAASKKAQEDYNSGASATVVGRGPDDFDYNALAGNTRYTYQMLPDWAKKYIDPTKKARDYDIRPTGGLYNQGNYNEYSMGFDDVSRDVQNNWIKYAQNKYAYDLANGAINKNSSGLKRSSSSQGGSVNNPKQITYASDRMADAIRRGVSSGKMDRSQLNNVHNRDTDANLGALLPNGTNNSALLEAMSYGVPLEMRKSIEAQAQQKGLYSQYMNRPVAYGNTSNASKPSQLVNQLTPTRKSPVPMPQKKPSALPSKQQAINRTPVVNNRVGVFGSPDQKQMIV